jgi:integrase/recombinase XerC
LDNTSLPAPLEIAPAELLPPLPPHRSVLDHWLDGLAPTTRRSYESDIGRFARAIVAASAQAAVEELLSLTGGQANELVLGYLHRMKSEGLSSATIARRLAAIRSVVKLARMLGRVDWSIEVQAPRAEARRDVRGPTPEERKQVWRVLKGKDSVRDRRDRALVALLFDLALRNSEARTIDLADVDVDGSPPSIMVLGKGRTEKERITLSPAAARDLRAWIHVRGDEPGPLLHRMDRGAKGQGLPLTVEGVESIIRSLGARAKLTRRLRPHGFRHAAITAALDSGRDIRAVRKFSRHQKLETVLRYDDAREDTAGEIAATVSRERK